MSLFFLHPAYLYALFAASLPLLIHLLNRRRLKRVRFPAVRFILLSQRRISRSHRLRHWIVLALRTFAVCLLVLLLSRPVFQTGAGLFAGGGPLSVVVLLDNSLSMKWSKEDEEGFVRAKEATRRLFSSLREGDRGAVIPTTHAGSGPWRLKADREVLIRDLEGIKIAGGTADFSLALKQAYALLREPAGQKEIWLITDMGLTGWDGFSLSQLEQYDPLIPLKILKVGEPSRLPNATLKEIKFESQGVGVGMPIHLQAQLVNFSDQEIKDLLVVLNLEGKNQEQKLVNLPAEAELAVSFQLSLNRPGAYSGHLELRKAGLAGNPTAYFTLEAQDKLRALIVDGDPGISLVQSETFFLARALNPAGEKDSSLFLPTVVIPEALNTIDFDPYQALIFCNVPVISDRLLPKLRDYLARGGGILFFVGDRVQMEDYNRKLFLSSPSILPARMSGKKESAGAAGETIDKLDAGHPALQGIKEPILQQSLRSTRVQGYLLTEPDGSSALLSLSNGAPLLLEKKVGSGRVLFFATAADRDWSDLPLKTVYLPLVQSLASYLAGGRRGTADAGLPVGNSKTISFPPSFVGRSLRVVRPDQTETEVSLKAEGGKAIAVITENDLTGIYGLFLPDVAGGGVPTPQLYAVNSPFLESRLKRIDDNGLRTKLSPIRAEIIPLKSLDEGGKSWDLSFSLLLLLMVTLAAEGWLAQRSNE